jgi:hypothetical protein
LINYVDHLFLGKKAIMFANQQKFVIHPVNKYCESIKKNETNEIEPVENQINEYLLTSYPKNKVFPLVFKTLLKHNIINSDLFFNPFPNIHIADFCAFLNNRFGKKHTTDYKMMKLCKYLQNNSIKFPKVAVKNPVAQKILS